MSRSPIPDRTRPASGLDGVRVLLVDDHDLFRSGLRSLLAGQGIEVVGEAPDGETAVRLAQELTPDVVVMDLNMPGTSGIETTRRLTDAAPLARVLVLTISAEDADVTNAVVAGASGYLLKDSSVPDLVAGIRAAAAGEALISPYIAARLLRQIRSQSVSLDAAETIRNELSDREIEVLKLIAIGKDNAGIAHELFISPKTVKNHISNILVKLPIENRVQAAVYAIRGGIV